jgi:gas vesicle protein
MDAAMVTAIAALIGGPVAAAAAMYGTRGTTRAAREGNAVNGFKSLTDELQEERTELRTELAAVRTELAAKELEIARLRLMVQQLGGTP